ncbi:PREDICTED: transcription factor MYB3-like [Nelumbo nucifera]|uniref:Transcription factor RAX2-like n=2 Tax=Nelumbo nucifera TaxID=4432 RepID=A0A823A0J1_NELNU|nr:PREDICTED: transcription factor MYB3-like [Nelumbo nucifera]DAD48839.1 TPA_asm: hypothetical protein HUJ06_018776 [Nelumbo nucifera]
MGRAPCCDKANVKKGPWSPEEDAKLKEFIEKYGTGGNWISLPQKAGLKRCGKSCRLRWLNYLRPNIKHGEFSDEEDRIIWSLYASIGSRWSIIASRLPGRTDNDIKNYWNTKLKKKIMGMAPSQRKAPHHQPSLPTHLPMAVSSPSQSLSSSSSSYQGSRSYYNPSESVVGLEPISIPSNLLSNCNTYTTTSTATATTSTLLQAQDGFMSPMHNYQVKEGLLMFGGEPSCSSSDGSCNQISYGKEMEYEYGGSGGGGGGVGNGEQMGLESFSYTDVFDNQKFMIGGNVYGGCGLDGWTPSQKPNDQMLVEPPLDYGLEEIKQLVSSNGCSNLWFDENKTQGRGMYY